MEESEILQLIETQTATIASLTEAILQLRARLEPIMKPTLTPEIPYPYPDPADSQISAALKENNYRLQVDDMYIRDALNRLEL